jgi:hypothetical protein
VIISLKPRPASAGSTSYHLASTLIHTYTCREFLAVLTVTTPPGL